MKFIIATNNKKKLSELGAILGKLGVRAISLSEAGIVSDAEETGATFEENSRIKAVSAMQLSGLPAIADDSGLVVDALRGEPGIYSARYGGDKCKDDTERYKYLLEKGYSRITLCGESAGGGLCYSLCLKLKELGLAQPGGIIAISPWVDLTASGPSYEENAAVDPSLNIELVRFFAKQYAEDYENPYVSPLVVFAFDLCCCGYFNTLSVPSE